MLFGNEPANLHCFFGCQLQKLPVSFLSTDPTCTILVGLGRRNGPSVSCSPNIVYHFPSKRFSRNGKQIVQGGLDFLFETQGKTVVANELWLDRSDPNRDGHLFEVEIEGARDECD